VGGEYSAPEERSGMNLTEIIENQKEDRPTLNLKKDNKSLRPRNISSD
jgi:hypothetical protein